MDTTIFLCEESPEGILSAVYEAYASRLGHSHIKLAFSEKHEPELFSRAIQVVTDPQKAEKVSESIRKKISPRAWMMVYRASLSNAETRANDIYRFLIGGFYYGSRVTSMLGEPEVQRIQELNRFVGNEAHYYREFLRFDVTESGVLLARIRPKCDVLTLLTPHFADRISGENFVILDVGRKVAAFHPSQKDRSLPTGSNLNWFLSSLSDEEMMKLTASSQDNYRDLWRIFFNSIAIEPRINPTLQRTHMAIRYREFATEFNTE